MPSPFPGMDPYLENPAFWSDFHATFSSTTGVKGWLTKCFPDSYEVRIDERVNLVEVQPDKIRRFQPDVHSYSVAAISRRRSRGVRSGDAGALRRPVIDRGRETSKPTSRFSIAATARSSPSWSYCPL